MDLAGLWESWAQDDSDLAEAPDGHAQRVERAGEMLDQLGATMAEVRGAVGPGPHWELLPKLARMGALSSDLKERIEASGAVGQFRSVILANGWADFAPSLEDRALNELSSLGRFDEATAWLEGCFRFYADLPICMAYLQVVAADVYRLQLRWDKAIFTLDEADAFLVTQPEEPYHFLTWEARCRSLGTRVQLEMQLGRIDRALRQSTAERALAQRITELDAGGAHFVGSARFRYLDLLLSAGSYKAVLDVVEPLLAAGRVSGDELDDMRYMRAMAHTGLELRDPDREPRARAEFEALLADSPERDLRRGSLLLGLSRLDLAAGDLPGLGERAALLEQLVEARAGGQGRESDVRLLATSRAVSAAFARLGGADKLTLGSHLELLEESLDALLAGWSVAPELTGGIGYLQDTYRRNLLGELVELCVALDRPEHALEQLMVVQSRGALSQSLGVQAPDLATLQATLVGDGGLLVYLPTLIDTHLLLVDRQGVQPFRLLRDRDLRALVREANFDVLANRSSGKGLDALSAALLPPGVVDRMKGWTHAYISGAEHFEQPRFALLPFGDSTLGRELGLATAPSLSLTAHLADRGASDEPLAELGLGAFELYLGPPVAAAAPESYRQLASLDFGSEAWDVLTDGLPEAAASLHVGQAASRAALLSADLGSARVLHLFCHGIHDVTQAQPAGLVLAGQGDDDGLLRWGAIAGLEVPELIILAACGGARSPGRQGEDGVEHLGGAFLKAGARTVLLSRADLEAASTLEVTGSFQRYLATGESPMEALRRARDDYAEAHGDELLVSSLFLLGAAHEPLFPKRDLGWLPQAGWLLALGGLGLCALGVILVRRR